MPLACPVQTLRGAERQASGLFEDPQDGRMVQTVCAAAVGPTDRVRVLWPAVGSARQQQGDL